MRTSGFVRLVGACSATARGGISACGGAVLALHAASATALDTQWRGAAARPYWDLAGNWTAGAPASLGTEAWLGSFDTVLRSGSFLARSIHGSGALQQSGGELGLGPGPSELGRLDLRGGRLAAAGPVVMKALRWSGGSLAGPGTWTVQGPAVLTGTGDLQFDDSAEWRLMGATRWEPGAPSISSYFGSVNIGERGRFVDQSGPKGHRLIGSTLVVEGRYLKTGSGTTEHWVSGFRNRGHVEVREGGIDSWMPATSGWTNAGHLSLAQGTAYSAALDRFGTIMQSGTVSIGRNARFELVYSVYKETSMLSSGRWRVAPGGLLRFDGSPIYYSPEIGSVFTGSIHNEGRVHFDNSGDPYGLARYRLTASADITGQGWVEIDKGSVVHMQGERPRTLGRLRIDGSQPYVDASQSTLRTDGRLTLTELEWGAGALETAGPVLVRGPAVLHHGTMRDAPGDHWYDVNPVYNKQLGSHLHLAGGAAWAADADLVGRGRIDVAAGTTFEERPLPQARAGGATRTTQLGVTAFRNQGTYLRNRPGATHVHSSFDNTGRVRSVRSGLLRFRGALDNRGTLEAVEGRIEVQGPLAQWSSRLDEGPYGEKVLLQALTGGRYVMNNGTLALRLGAPEGDAPGHILDNHASILLQGPQARLVNPWSGSDIDALGRLRHNTGELRLLQGASLRSERALENAGTLEVGDGSRLELADGTYSQTSDSAETWIGGELEASLFDFQRGRFGAGRDGEVGVARLEVAEASFNEGVLDVDITDRTRFDMLIIEGRTHLYSTRLWADFGSGPPMLGTYRILTSAQGLSGQLGGLGSNLDLRRYTLSAEYGPNFIDLQVGVAEVPEPQTAVLLVMGLGGVATAAARRRRAAETLDGS
ncbi:PEP-CTERM sorting domain-containing protein [Aquabacterium sp. A7-Y]|uniref:PEP-CTERM sorting domain-containing protein n=1 Tax=Aquabacterium sp. A7-Y TaxID=1349605 RepID=UPI00223DFF20|nr:PEP-CTERM sorting domain-containing protein [Aquabacterium sp. A7-Y]MCW7541862.1 PEP-CTERM sorting domain-containing protein [Aquabacterium sp. A7-Y]